jgi:hypothetical protein
MSLKTHVATLSLQLKSTFDEKIQISSYEFTNYGNLFELKWSNKSANEKDFNHINPKTTKTVMHEASSVHACIN